MQTGKKSQQQIEAKDASLRTLNGAKVFTGLDRHLSKGFDDGYYRLYPSNRVRLVNVEANEHTITVTLIWKKPFPEDAKSLFTSKLKVIVENYLKNFRVNGKPEVRINFAEREKSHGASSGL